MGEARGVETLVELAEAGQLPTPAALAADFDDRQSCDEDDDCPGMESGDDSDEEEIPLDEMPEDMIFDDRAPQQQEIALAESVGEDRLALSGERCAFSQGHPELALLLESFLDELRLKRFNAEEREMLDARCQAMVEAGALRPSSLMRAELTGRVDLRAENLKFDNPTPGTSVTGKMLHLLQATSCSQRESNMMMRSEWGGPEGAVDAALTVPASLTATQIDPRHPDLTQEQEAASDKEYSLASTQPWQVSGL
ncbi:hypothetical protein CYMTET_11692 [Cymbomonas tetramitiformis]|uniref:Uncharacterized protein n=1 Tax=Cymbomonas tetramitiformis TaxID=36881 RepID=A0AAE0GLY7_9CHLO|nr:hypothetical protein CYMTET_11692 [Cymbomonas tetramitiformis]